MGGGKVMNCLIDLESIRCLRKALIVGLSSYGEVERLTDKWELLHSVGEKPDKGLKPVHPTGSNDTVGDFADALAYLEGFEHELSET
jgi:hypothetical protein